MMRSLSLLSWGAFIFSLCLFVLQTILPSSPSPSPSPSSFPINISIDRPSPPSFGFHHTLSTTITLSPLSPSPSLHCDFLLFQSVPSSMYFDPHEVRRYLTHRNQNDSEHPIKVSYSSFPPRVDIESPMEFSDPATAVFSFAVDLNHHFNENHNDTMDNKNNNNSLAVSFTVPLHVRYHLSQRGKYEVEATMTSPRAYCHCYHNGNQHDTHPHHENTTNPYYSFSYDEIPLPHDLSFTVIHPIANGNMFPFVVLFTICCVLISSFFLAKELNPFALKMKNDHEIPLDAKDLNKKKKNQ